MSDLPEYRIVRRFNAPRELVWRAWTDPEILHQWYGPGVETVIHRFDLEPDGFWLNEMKWGDNSNFSKMVFQEVTPPEKLIWRHHSCTDADWNDTVNPMMADWPRLLLTTVTLTEHDGQTDVVLTQVPMEASDAEITCFAEAMANMDKGWGAGFSLLEQLLGDLSG